MFGKVVKSTVAGQVIDQIKQLLGTGELRPGDKLPAERQLAELLGVSRPSLREALRALEYAGVLETHMGEGIFVADGSSIVENNLHLTYLIKQFALEEMIEVRKVIESAGVKLATQRATEEELENIAATLAEAEKNLDDMSAFVLSDYAFHRAVVDASGNAILATMLQTMRKMMSEFNIQLLVSREGRKEVLRHHHEIFKSIRDRDETKAMENMAIHLENVVHTMKDMR